MDNKKSSFYLRYIGLTTQFLVAIGIAVYGGMALDKWMTITIPLAVWLLPLLVITGVIIKIIKDTGKKQ